jgi:hypothetical protein
VGNDHGGAGHDGQELQQRLEAGGYLVRRELAVGLAGHVPRVDVPRHDEFGAQAQLPLDTEHPGGGFLVTGGNETGLIRRSDVGVEADDAALVDVVHGIHVGDLGAGFGRPQRVAEFVDGRDAGLVAAAEELFAEIISGQGCHILLGLLRDRSSCQTRRGHAKYGVV